MEGKQRNLQQFLLTATHKLFTIGMGKSPFSCVWCLWGLLDVVTMRRVTLFVATLMVQLPQHKDQSAHNLRRWSELLADPQLSRFEGRIETDRHGHIVMSPPPAPAHGSFQSEIAYLLRSQMQAGRVLTECPISSADGVKAADVAWASPGCMQALGEQVCFPRAPEICVEVLSPGNTDAEIREKIVLYFDAGCTEVWLCGQSGEMSFFGPRAPRELKGSELCPHFPKQIELP